jgi:hypothetical protein
MPYREYGLIRVRAHWYIRLSVLGLLFQQSQTIITKAARIYPRTSAWKSLLSFDAASSSGHRCVVFRWCASHLAAIWASGARQRPDIHHYRRFISSATVTSSKRVYQELSRSGSSRNEIHVQGILLTA